MISNENINDIITAGAAEGYTLTVDDISNAILARHYEDWDNIADDAKEYFGGDPMKWLARRLSETVFNDADITFEDNKKSLIGLIEKTQREAKMGMIEPKDAIKLEGDLRIKLNDKFNVQDDTRDKMVIVEPRYNMVCRHGYECYLPTKEDLMKMYNLVEKKK